MEATEGLALVLTDAQDECVAVRLSPPGLGQGGSGYALFSQLRVPPSLFAGVDLCSLTEEGGEL